MAVIPRAVDMVFDSGDQERPGVPSLGSAIVGLQSDAPEAFSVTLDDEEEETEDEIRARRYIYIGCGCFVSVFTVSEQPSPVMRDPLLPGMSAASNRV